MQDDYLFLKEPFWIPCLASIEVVKGVFLIGHVATWKKIKVLLLSKKRINIGLTANFS